MQICLMTKMIRINANIGDITIVNGKIVKKGEADKTYTFDERKIEEARNIDKIVIDTPFANVNILPCDFSKVEAHLYGNVSSDGNFEFDVHIERDELRINLKSIGSYVIGNLNLDLAIPYKTFRLINVITSSGNVIIKKGVLAQKLKVKTMSGNLNAVIRSGAILANTMSGNVELYVNALEDVDISVSTMSGEVLTQLNNIGQLNCSTSSMSGRVQKMHKGKDGYTADVDISTMSGNVTIEDYRKKKRFI